MDYNGLSDPYVKLHLLPGASKVSVNHFYCFLVGDVIVFCLDTVIIISVFTSASTKVPYVV